MEREAVCGNCECEKKEDYVLVLFVWLIGALGHKFGTQVWNFLNALGAINISKSMSCVYGYSHNITFHY